MIYASKKSFEFKISKTILLKDPLDNQYNDPKNPKFTDSQGIIINICVYRYLYYFLRLFEHKKVIKNLKKFREHIIFLF
jgi:hypothetical protein